MSILTFEERLPGFVTEADNLPSIPAVALEVLRLTQDEDSTIDELADCLSRDPALAAKILKLSNSSLFSTGQAISSLSRATMMLGLKTVKLMSLSFSLVSSVPKEGVENGFDFQIYWRRSLVRSVAARSLVERVRSPLGDEGFLCGLLAHFGRLVMARVVPDEYREVADEAGGWPSCALEERRLGFSNSDVCATLLKQWGVPELVYLATGFWNRPEGLPSDAPEGTHELVELLQATALAEEVLCGDDKGNALKALVDLTRERYDMGERDVEHFLTGLEHGIAETAEMLSIELPDGKSHEEIMAEAKLEMVQVSIGQAAELNQTKQERERLAAEKETLITKATTDKLTGLPNRASFDEFLETHVAKRLQPGEPLALGLALIDIDHFKGFNDTYGHQAGDEVLRHVGEVLARLTRKGDLAARYGGEEFAVIAPQTNPFNVRTMCERLRKEIEAMEIEFEGQTLKVTASFGAACISQFDSEKDLELLIKLSDSLLYRAKENGRNRTETYKKMAFKDR